MYKPDRFFTIKLRKTVKNRFIETDCFYNPANVLNEPITLSPSISFNIN